jgi:hypothetical protein
MPDRFATVRARTEALLLRSGRRTRSCSRCRTARRRSGIELTPLVLRRVRARRPRPANRFLWNSYYEAVGPRQPRHHRGLLTRPTCADVAAYRESVDERVIEAYDDLDEAGRALVELGCNHEEQHQELLLMDAKHLLAQNPLHPS